MKSLFSTILLLGSFFVTSTTILLAAPNKVSLPLSHAYIPLGNDSNDNVEIIVEGYLPNLCYEMGDAEFLKSGKQIIVTMNGIYHPEWEPFCMQTVYYFEKKLNLRHLDVGHYDVKLLTYKPDEDSDDHIKDLSPAPKEWVGRLVVDSPKAKTIDDYLYANTYEIQRTSNKNQIILSGVHPEDCLALKRIEFISNGVDTLSILPIMEQTKTTCFEPIKKVPFEYTVTLPEGTPKRSKILVHVRTGRGEALNKIIRH